MSNTRLVPNFLASKFLPMAVLGLLLVISHGLRAQTFEVLHAFAGGNSDGANPEGGLVMDGNGNLYGTTLNGGSTNKYDQGTIFGVNPGGTETLIHHFSGGARAFPEGGLIFDSNGNFYGTTAGTNCSTGCYGTVFKMNPQHVVTVLYFFRSPSNGAKPEGELVMDGQGNLYGTTAAGGTYNLGTVFKLTPQGVETVLHSFGAPSDGGTPNGGLSIDTKGSLYGTTQDGGSIACDCGTVFKITPSGSYAVIYRFKGGADGSIPEATVILDSAGNLYGTTLYGGNPNCESGQCGTVFKLTPNRTKTVLHNFVGGSDGFLPKAPLVMDSQGNLYGTTSRGGSETCLGLSGGCGVVFKITPSGHESVLHPFIGTDGVSPRGPLLLDSHGNLYGTTFQGGNLADCQGNGPVTGCGVLFKLTP